MSNDLVAALTTPAAATSGLGRPARAFKGTVIGTSPLRVQAASGVDIQATAAVGLTPAIGWTVLVLSTGAEFFVVVRV